MTTLSIIILSYNTKDLTLACIQSVFRYYRQQLDQGEFEIIVVDNNSKDDSIKEIKKSFDFTSLGKTQDKRDKIFVIENSENFGFSKGNNIGAKAARGKFILFLNSDTQVLDDSLLKMVECLEKHSEIGILGGVLQNKEGSDQGSAGIFYNLFPAIIMLIGGERVGLIRPHYKSTSVVDWVAGGFMMVRKEIFQKLGGFDENLFMYLEDMELCYRARLKGYRTALYPDAKILHKGQGSSDRSFAISQIYKGTLYFYKKHKPYWQYRMVRLLLSAKAHTAVILGKFFHNMNLRNTYTKALSAI